MYSIEKPTDSVLARELVALAIKRYFLEHYSKDVLPDQKRIGEEVGMLGRVGYRYEHEGIRFLARVGQRKRRGRDVPAVFFIRISAPEKPAVAHRQRHLFFSPDRSHEKYVRLIGQRQ
ncbi:MAG: hypothetical protein WCJ25_01355 [Candidatus Moraniibacteriota bacterium]